LVGDEGSRKDKVAALWDEFSGSFDEVAGRLMTAYARLLLREIVMPGNPVCLDVGCGTGVSTFELARRIEGEGTIYGIDFSQPMIDQAEKNAERLGFPDIKFSAGDAERLDFPDSMFDLVLSNQVLPFIPDKRRALMEMHRVLRPGGQAALMFYGGPVYQEGVRIVLEVASRHPEYPSFMDAVVEFRDDLIGLEDAVDLFESAGFMDHRIYGRHKVVFFDPSSWLEAGVFWDMWRSGLPSDAEGGIRDELRAECRRLSEAKGFKHTLYDIIAVGVKVE
jgi:ubiquinone/menaquinone biosynthesis C-methylase UbiE